MQRDWARLGAVLKAARQERGTNQVEMGERIGLSRSAVQNIERGSIKKVSPALRAFAREVGWTDDSIEEVLAGNPPTMAEHAEPAQADETGAATSGLPLRIARELEGGQLLDSTVIPLSDDGGGRMVIVVRGQPDASPEEIKRALLEWERRERQLRARQTDENQGPPANEA